MTGPTAPVPPPPPAEIDDTIAELEILVTFLRRRGVVSYEEGPDSRKLIILPDEPAPTEKEAEVKEVDKPTEPEKLGKDGLSREMQTELYGRPMPDWE